VKATTAPELRFIAKAVADAREHIWAAAPPKPHHNRRRRHARHCVLRQAGRSPDVQEGLRLSSPRCLVRCRCSRSRTATVQRYG
jgi:hypothetical protein